MPLRGIASSAPVPMKPNQPNPQGAAAPQNPLLKRTEKAKAVEQTASAALIKKRNSMAENTFVPIRMNQKQVEVKAGMKGGVEKSIEALKDLKLGDAGAAPAAHPRKSASPVQNFTAMSAASLSELSAKQLHVVTQQVESHVAETAKGADFDSLAQAHPFLVGPTTVDEITSCFISAKPGQWLLWSREVRGTEGGMVGKTAMLSFQSATGLHHIVLKQRGDVDFDDSMTVFHEQFPLTQSLHEHFSTSSVAEAIQERFSTMESFLYDKEQAKIQACRSPGEFIIHKNHQQKDHFFITYSIDAKNPLRMDIAVHFESGLSPEHGHYVAAIQTHSGVKEIPLNANFMNAMKAIMALEREAPRPGSAEPIAVAPKIPKSFSKNVERYLKQYERGYFTGPELLQKLKFILTKAPPGVDLQPVATIIENVLGTLHQDPREALKLHPLKVSPAVLPPHANAAAQLEVRDAVHALLKGKPSGTWLLYDDPVKKKLMVLVMGINKHVQEFEAPADCNQLHFQYLLQKNAALVV